MEYVGNALLHDLTSLRQSGKFGAGKLSEEEKSDLISKLDDIESRLTNRLACPPQKYGQLKYPHKAGKTQDQYILNVLFSDSRQKCENIYAATMLCVLSFVNWCKGLILNGTLPGELLLRFSLECHMFRVLEGDYFTHGYISNTPISMVHYNNIAKTALFNYEIEDQTSLLLAIFGFRQVFENRCKGMIGYLGSSPLLKYHDGVFAEVLENASGLKDHITTPHISILDLAKLADWTNWSIHNQIIPPAWMIWKLFNLSEWFFSPPRMTDTSKAWSIFGSYSCSTDDLKTMRDDFVSRIKQSTQRYPDHVPKEYTLYWENRATHLELVITNPDELSTLDNQTIVSI